MSTKAKTEPSQKIPRHAGGAFNPRKATAPIAAFAMAVILYTYSVSSIRAAKRNAKLTREADGGQVDMRKESLRRHGVLEKVEGTSDYQLFRNQQAQDRQETENTGANQAPPPTQLGPREEQAARTDVESALQEHKTLGNAFKQYKPKRPD